MKLLVALAVVACLGVASADLLATLQAVHNSSAWQQLPSREQILVIELIAEIEAGQLKQYIDTVGYNYVLQLLDHLPEREAKLLNHLLHQELQKEAGNLPTDAPPSVGRRLVMANEMNKLLHNAAYQHLPTSDQEMMKHMLDAAHNCTLSAFVGQLGYTEVIRLMEQLPPHEGHLFNHYIVQHMSAESHGNC